jgi:hypothetical protein
MMMAAARHYHYAGDDYRYAAHTLVRGTSAARHGTVVMAMVMVVADALLTGEGG